MENNKRARTFTGCWTCRLRKRRCDLVKPVCSSCQKRGDACSYDIKLIWQPVNMLNLSNTHVNNGRKYTGKRLSKNKFKQIMELHRANEKDTNCANSFTISVRRFRVYDNCIKSVYGGKSRERSYDSRIVDERLDSLLNELQLQIDNQYDYEFKSGPFNAFSITRKNDISKLDSINENNNCEFLDSEDTLTSTIFSHLESPEPIFNFTNHNEFSNTNYTTLDHSISVKFKLRDKLSIFILSNCPQNMVLGRDLYKDWFLNHVETYLNYDVDGIIDQILNDKTDTIKIEDIISIVPDNDLQTICLTIYLIINYNKSNFELKLLEKWVLNKDTISYNMYPIINYVIKNTQDLQILDHAHQLIVSGKRQYEDLYQDELNSEINVSVELRLVCKWKDKILQQLYQGLDTTISCSQLNYWEKELRFNEQVYRDIYL